MVGRMLRPFVSLVKAKESDYELMLAWRNNPLINKGFYSQRGAHFITWDEHTQWLGNLNKDWRIFMIYSKEHRIGVVSIANLDHWAPEIGYYIGEVTLWRMGLATSAVWEALRYLWDCHGKQWARTTILDDNTASIRVCEKLGFQKLGPARPGESWYQTDLQLLFSPPKRD